jgi:hypothetical protein
VKKDWPDPQVISGPTLSPFGHVMFGVRYRDGVITVWQGPVGMGAEVEDVDAWNAACKAVRSFWRPSEEEKWGAFRAAARLRKAAGNPAPSGNTRSPEASVVGEPTVKGSFVIYETRVRTHAIRVYILDSRIVSDDCDDWSGVTNEDRDAAITVALDHVFSHPEESRAVGLDLALLDELWR